MMRIVWIALMLAATTPMARAQDYAQVALPDARQEAAALALMDTIRCVVCQGQPVSGSNATLAADMRRVIREHIAAGEDPEATRAWLVARYGDWISLKPSVSSATLPLWAVPLLALLGGLVLAWRRFRKGRP